MNAKQCLAAINLQTNQQYRSWVCLIYMHHCDLLLLLSLKAELILLSQSWQKAEPTKHCSGVRGPGPTLYIPIAFMLNTTSYFWIW